MRAAIQHVHVRLEGTDSIAIVTPRREQEELTEKEVYKELGGPIEHDAKVDTERTRRCTGSHPNAED